MPNIIRADLYRILRGKGIYITFGTLALLFVLLGSIRTVGINVGIHTGDTVVQNDFNGMSAPFVMMALMDFLIYFTLPMIIFTVSADFSSGAVKNTLSNGTSRIKLYMSKLVLSSLLCAALVCFSIIVPMLVGTIVNGFGGKFTSSYFISLLKPLAAQFFLMLAVTCIGVFITFLTKNTASVIVLYLAFFLVPSTLITIISQFWESAEKLFCFDLAANIKLMAKISDLPVITIGNTISIGLGYIALSIVGGIAAFRKSEIK